jgi:hypothetical protein
MKTVRATLAITLGLSVCAIAAAPAGASYDAVPSAEQSQPVPERVAGALQQQLEQQQPVSERVSGAQQQQPQPLSERVSGAQRQAVVPEQQAVAPAEPAVPAVSSDDGLSALAIVFISLGGALALAGIAYSARWVMIHHGHGHAAA